MVWLHRAVFLFLRVFSFTVFCFSSFQFFGLTVFQFLRVFALDASFLISEHTYIHIHHGISPQGQ